MAENGESVIRRVLERVEQYRARAIDPRIAERDDMLGSRAPEKLAAYMNAGRSAIDNVARAMILAGRPDVHSVLDLPCGFGRVLRHLVAFFPDTRIVACDLYPERVDFCTKTFGVDGAYSSPDLDGVDLGCRFDLVWCGSLLTHLPEPGFRSALRLLGRLLSERGLAVASLHGRFSPTMQRQHFKYLPDAAFAGVEAAFRERGFGYADYPEAAGRPDRERYGVALTAPSYVLQTLERDPEIRVFGYQERAWDHHHDVVIFGKPPVAG